MEFKIEIQFWLDRNHLKMNHCNKMDCSNIVLFENNFTKLALNYTVISKMVGKHA